MHRSRVVIAVLVALSALALASCDDESGTGVEADPRPTSIDGAVVLSQAWRGEWNTVIEFRDCNNGQLVAVEDVVDVICGSDTLRLDVSPLLLDCDGLIDDGRIDAACSYTYIVDAACEVTIDLLLNLDVEGDVVTGTGKWTAETLGPCSVDYPAGCEQIVVTATRLDPSPEPCESASLGSLERIRSLPRSRGDVR